jgi:hypothetical protein
MPRPPARFFPNTWFLPAIHYPHMQRTERAMFRDWLIHRGQSFDGFMFDVRVGNGKAVPGDVPENIAAMWRTLTKKRIDAIGYKGNETWLIEIKKRMTIGILAQIDVYAWLLLSEYFPDGPFRKLCIVGDIDPDLMDIAKQKQIEINVVPIPVFAEG